MKIKLLSLIIVCLAVVSCQSTMMKTTANQTLSVPSQETSRLIFLRTSFVGSAIQSSVFDITGGQIKFIGIVSAKTRVVYDGPAGKRMFMVIAENADFMAADMQGGKTYYTIVIPRFGVMKARFSLLPVRKTSGKHNLNSPTIKSGMKHPIVENKPESLQWYEKNKAGISAKYKRYWKKWVAKPGADKAQRTLFASDGI